MALFYRRQSSTVLSFSNFTPAEPVCPLAMKCIVAMFKQTSPAGGITDLCVCCFMLNLGVLWHWQHFMFYYLAGQTFKNANNGGGGSYLV